MRKLEFCSVLAVVATISACSSSSGNGGSADFEGALGLIDRSNSASMAAVENLPSNATMSGGLQVFVSGQDETILGNMNVEADFDNSAVSGSATNLGVYELVGSFGSENECLAGASCSAELVGELDGTLDLAGDITGNTFDGTLNGDVTGSNDAGDLASSITLAVDGSFLEDSEGLLASADLSGTSDNTITTAEGTETDQTDLSGIFVVAE